MDCLFCKIINGEIPSYKIYEDDLVYAFLDVNPKENGHTLIVPKKHYTDYLSLPNLQSPFQYRGPNNTLQQTF